MIHLTLIIVDFLTGLLAAGEDSQQYGFRIEHQGRLIAKGRAAVMLRD